MCCIDTVSILIKRKIDIMKEVSPGEFVGTTTFRNLNAAGNSGWGGLSQIYPSAPSRKRLSSSDRDSSS
jgi:hypothetical protein